ncbi:MAG: hypothetical protein AAF352_06440 [Pseudomonadota bacterium]
MRRKLIKIKNKKTKHAQKNDVVYWRDYDAAIRDDNPNLALNSTLFPIVLAQLHMLWRASFAGMIERPKQSFQDAFAKYPLQDVGTTKILPPFLGEMGIEVRGFLGLAEPWLRNGWKIPALRPEFYPPGQAFRDDMFFAQIETLRASGRMVPSMFSFIKPHRTVNYDDMALNDFGVAWQPAPVNFHGLSDEIIMESYIQGIAHARYPAITQNVTPLHDMLSRFSLHYGEAWPAYRCVRPSYLPEAFSNPQGDAYPDHIGIQLRNFPEKESTLDAHACVKIATELSKAWGLPVLVYGEPKRTLRIKNRPNTWHLCGDTPLLTYEMGCLRTCKMMLSPSSGWVDVMCWLQVPTIIFDVPTSFFTRDSVGQFGAKVAYHAHLADDFIAKASALRDCEEHYAPPPQEDDEDVFAKQLRSMRDRHTYIMRR